MGKPGGKVVTSAGMMEDWVSLEGEEIYLGSLVKPGRTVVACTCSDAGSMIVSDAEYIEFPTPVAE